MGGSVLFGAKDLQTFFFGVQTGANGGDQTAEDWDGHSGDCAEERRRGGGGYAETKASKNLAFNP